MTVRYGYCTGFASSMTGPVSYPLLEDILAAGYDYVEFPLMQTAALSGEDFDALERWLKGNGLGCDCTCNMFPPQVRLTGERVDLVRVRDYLEGALERLERLGTRKIVLGSSGARNLPQGIGEAAGYDQLAFLMEAVVIPLLERHDMTVAIEPINRDEANFIRTLPEGMKLVRRLDHPRVRLLADTIHMLREEESPAELTQYRPWLEHVHVSELGRGLPVWGYTPELAALLSELRAAEPTGTVSFETGPAGRTEMARALARLRAALEG